jgi:hypothetical protein
MGGEVILINADTREDADAMACMGLQDTIDALRARTTNRWTPPRRWVGLARSAHIGRMEAATKPASDMSDAFVRDQAAIRPLIGDDIVLSHPERTRAPKKKG